MGTCVDEDKGCPTETYILCGFKVSSDMGTQVDFLSCMDDHNGTAAVRAQTCAINHHIPWPALSSCASSQEQTVLQAAADYFAKHTEVDGFPTIQVNGREPWGRTYQDIIEALCKTGISAGVCKAQAFALPPLMPSPSTNSDAVVVV